MLVIFDCDGVVVDSELLANTVLTEALNELGMSLSLAETINRYMGRSMASCQVDIQLELGRKIPDSFWHSLQEKTFQAFTTSLRPIEGIEEVLNTLTLPYCMASSGSHEKMNQTLGITGLRSYFDGKRYSATEVSHGKPAPDLFLHAAANMGYPPQQCIVIEDSLPGVTAALAANMTPLGFCQLTPPSKFEECNITTFSHMSELVPLIMSLCQHRTT